MQKLDAEPDGNRGEEGGRFAETSPRTRRRVSFTGLRSSVVVLYAGPSFSGYECLWGAGILEGYEALAAGGGGSAVYFDPCGEGGVIDGGNAVQEARSMFGDRGRWVPEEPSPGVTVETKVHAGVVSGRKGGRSWSDVEVPAGGAMIALISWMPLSEGETRVGRDGRGGGGQAGGESS